MTLSKFSPTNLLHRCFPAAFFCIAMLAFFLFAFHFAVTLQSTLKQADDGQILLHSDDFLQQKTIGLDGQWYFFPSQLVDPQNVEGLLKGATTIKGSGGWKFDSQDMQKQVEGYGTYYLKVNLDTQDINLAMQIPYIETAYNLYIDNRLVASGGVVSASVNGAEPGFNSSIITLPQNVDAFTITLQVSNYHSAWGGIWLPFVVGEVDAIYSERQALVALSVFIIGVLAVTVAFYLIQYYLRPSDKIPLAFACFCFILFLREFTAEHMHFALAFLGFGHALVVKLNYLSFYIALPAVIYFMQLCFRHSFNSKLLRVLYGVSIIYSLFVLFSPTRYIGLSLTSYQIFALLTFIYILNGLIMAARAKQLGANMMILGGMFVIVFAINDMLHANGIINTGRFINIGIVALIICQSYIINKRFNNIITDNESLTEQLQQHNADLEALGAQLEIKVEQRTTQLKLVNKELKNLVNIDSLTGVLNREGLQQHLKSAYERLRRSHEPSSIILFDFDHFKRINDTFGHDAGDKILVSGAKVIQNFIREQDKLIRWGGEEFLVLLPDTELNGAEYIGNKLRCAISEQLADEIPNNVSVEITVTGGVSEFRRDETFEVLFKRADNALYKGKKAGRNCIRS
jgi:diguanylate cyclase (GGDEF)-like protein